MECGPVPTAAKATAISANPVDAVSHVAAIKFELAFWGSTGGVPYRRFHKTVEEAMQEAHRVQGEMSNAGAHTAIIFDLENGEQLRSIW